MPESSQDVCVLREKQTYGYLVCQSLSKTLKLIERSKLHKNVPGFRLKKPVKSVVELVDSGRFLLIYLDFLLFWFTKVGRNSNLGNFIDFSQ